MRIVFIVALLPLIAAAQPAWLNDGLVAYYPFDGDAKDYSGNGNDGVINGAALGADRFGFVDSSYFFDGADDFIQSRSAVSIQQQNLTLSAWVNSSNVTTMTKGVVSIPSHTNGSGIRIGIESGSLDAPNPPLQANYVADGEWHHVTVVSSGSKVEGYIDGIPVGFHNDSRNLTLNVPIQIGRETITKIGDGSGTRSFNGFIDEVRIYNCALNSKQVAQLYVYESMHPKMLPVNKWLNKGLVAFFRLDGTGIDQINKRREMRSNLVSPSEDRFGNAAGATRFSKLLKSGLLTNQTAQLPKGNAARTYSMWLRPNFKTTTKPEVGSLLLDFDRAHDEYGGGRLALLLASYGWLTVDGGHGAYICDKMGEVLDSEEWFHICITFQKNVWQCYVNGSLIEWADKPYSNYYWNTYANASMLIGSNKRNQHYEGSMDDLRIYDRALSPEEVKGLFTYEKFFSN